MAPCDLPDFGNETTTRRKPIGGIALFLLLAEFATDGLLASDVGAAGGLSAAEPVPAPPDLTQGGKRVTKGKP